MPDTAHKKNDQDIEITAPLAASAPAQREIDVIAQPGGEGDVPSAPEVTCGGGGIGHREVLGQVETEDLAAANGDGGIACEIAKDLDGVECCRQSDLHGAVFPVASVHGVDEDRRPVGDDHLEEAAPEDGDEATFDAVKGEEPGSLLACELIELWNEDAGALDGPRGNLGEEGHVDEVLEEAALWFDLAGMHVGHIRDGSERVERDADGNQEVEVGDIGDEERYVLRDQKGK